MAGHRFALPDDDLPAVRHERELRERMIAEKTQRVRDNVHAQHGIAHAEPGYGSSSTESTMPMVPSPHRAALNASPSRSSYAVGTPRESKAAVRTAVTK